MHQLQTDLEQQASQWAVEKASLSTEHETALAVKLNELQDTQNQLKERDAAHDVLVQEVASLQEKATQAQAELAEIQARVEQVTNERAALEADLTAGKQSQGELEAQHEKDLAEHKGLLDASFLDAEEAGAKMELLEKEVRRLKAEALRLETSQSAVVSEPLRCRLLVLRVIGVGWGCVRDDFALVACLVRNITSRHTQHTPRPSAP